MTSTEAIEGCLRTSRALANAACPLDDKPYVRSPLNDRLHELAWWWFVQAHKRAHEESIGFVIEQLDKVKP